MALRTMAIDLGTRRVGIALGDDLSRLATPMAVLEVSTPAQALAEVMKWVEAEAPDQIVLGLPLNMDDSSGPAAQQALKWGRELHKCSGKRVLFVDERLSSFAAEQQMIHRQRGGQKLTRRQKKVRLDAIAAADFLQAYLDGRLQPLPDSSE